MRWRCKLSQVSPWSESGHLVHFAQNYKPYPKEYFRTVCEPIVFEGNQLICNRWWVNARPETVEIIHIIISSREWSQNTHAPCGLAKLVLKDVLRMQHNEQPLSLQGMVFPFVPSLHRLEVPWYRKTSVFLPTFCLEINDKVENVIITESDRSDQLILIIRQQKCLAFYDLVNLLDGGLCAVFPCIVVFLLHWQSIRIQVGETRRIQQTQIPCNVAHWDLKKQRCFLGR